MRSLFGGTRAAASAEAGAPAVDYNGYAIRPTPSRQGSQWTTEGVITKQFPDGVKECRFIRADIHNDRNDAVSTTIAKAKRLIDEQGDRIFPG